MHNSKIYIKESWFLCSACRPILVNISMMFHEYTLKSFKVKEQTRFCKKKKKKKKKKCYLQSSNGHNSKHIYPRFMVLAICVSSNTAYIYTNVFQVRPTKRTRFKTDRRAWQKQWVDNKRRYKAIVRNNSAKFQLYPANSF